MRIEAERERKERASGLKGSGSQRLSDREAFVTTDMVRMPVKVSEWSMKTCPEYLIRITKVSENVSG